MLPGQITIWDIEITEKVNKKTEKPFIDTEKSKEVTEDKNKHTTQQQIVIEKYKSLSELNRVISYSGGGVGIELVYGSSYRTIYVNSQGKEEFTSERKLPVLPMDKIIYYQNPIGTFNDTQEDKLKELMVKYPEAKVIRRKADDRIHVGLVDKVISINPIGWILEYQGCKAVYEDDEVDIQKPILETNAEEAQSEIKLGDIIEAQHGQRLIKGEIVNVYGPGGVTLNIVFDNGTKHTAIHRSKVTKLIKCA